MFSSRPRRNTTYSSYKVYETLPHDYGACDYTLTTRESCESSSTTNFGFCDDPVEKCRTGFRGNPTTTTTKKSVLLRCPNDRSIDQTSDVFRERESRARQSRPSLPPSFPFSLRLGCQCDRTCFTATSVSSARSTMELLLSPVETLEEC